MSNPAIWRGRSYLGLGVGAVSTLGGTRRRNAPSLGRYVSALRAGSDPPREMEALGDETRALELLMLGLRLDEPLSLAGLEATVDHDAVGRLQAGGLVERRQANGETPTLTLTPRGRFLGSAVTAELFAG